MLLGSCAPCDDLTGEELPKSDVSNSINNRSNVLLSYDSTNQMCRDDLSGDDLPGYGPSDKDLPSNIIPNSNMLFGDLLGGDLSDGSRLAEELLVGDSCNSQLVEDDLLGGRSPLIVGK